MLKCVGGKKKTCRNANKLKTKYCIILPIPAMNIEKKNHIILLLPTHIHPWTPLPIGYPPIVDL